MAHNTIISPFHIQHYRFCLRNTSTVKAHIGVERKKSCTAVISQFRKEQTKWYQERAKNQTKEKPKPNR